MRTQQRCCDNKSCTAAKLEDDRNDDDSHASAAIGTLSASIILLYSEIGLLKSEFLENVAGPVMRLP